MTGHAEAVQVLFDPKVITYKEIVKKYLTMFRPMRRSADKFSQYRAAIFYEDETQKKQAQEALKELMPNVDSSELLEPAKKFYPAEEYHQNYYKKMSLGAYR